MKKKVQAVLLLLFVFQTTLSQSASSINGYFKNYSAAIDLPTFRSSTSNLLINQPPLGWVNNRLRLTIYYQIHSNLSFSGAYDFAPRIQDPSLFGDQPLIVPVDPSAYRFADLDRQLYPSENNQVESFAIFQNLDRAFFSLRTSFTDLFIGRQAIAWGSARVVNPTDIFAPFAFYELDSEDRVGVDAIRARIPAGFMGELDAGYIFGKDFQFDKSAFYFRGKIYTMETDISSLILSFRENLLIGIDVARSIGGAGFWLESAYVFTKVLKDHSNNINKDYFRLSCGSDYSFGDKTYAFFEFHFNGAGSTNPKDYVENFSKIPYTEGAVYLTGKYYLAPGMSYQITPLIIFTTIGLFNLNDPSIFFTPLIEYNISENIYLSGGIYFGVGKTALFTEDRNGLDISYQSEFGSYPNLYYTSFRIYF
jgi:hypothetical protein